MSEEISVHNDPWWIIPVAVFATIVTVGVCVSIPYFIGPGEAANFAEAKAKVGGNPERGLQLMKRYGCAACHIVPGLSGANGTVGPSLRGFASMPLIGKHVQNTPENLVNWIVRPVDVDPTATMPSVGATPQDARDMATYLYALK